MQLLQLKWQILPLSHATGVGASRYTCTGATAGPAGASAGFVSGRPGTIGAQAHLHHRRLHHTLRRAGNLLRTSLNSEACL